MFTVAFIAKAFAVGVTGLFAGGATITSLAIGPALERSSAAVQKEFFPTFWPLAARLMAPLGAAGLVGHGASYYLTKDVRWLVGAGVFAAVMVWTFVAMLPGVEELRDPAAAKKSDAWFLSRVKSFHLKHGVRTALSLGALAYGLYLVAA
eukprot:TRINITY_DN10131_c0_g1_i2.p1 TRINITY_DN10131_c0_g1~~TRINITY_DN10131_c0_g1_i2.p1  ORF type:complete len:150 (+),score=30.06 TRINITY_DN10131_c0_g1_i2:107-556(+)